MLSGVFLLAGTSVFGLSPVVIAAIIVLSAVAALLETRRRRERALLGNLGATPYALTILFLIPATVGELVLHLAAAALR